MATLAIDGSTPTVATGSTKTLATGSFTPPNGALILPLWSANSTLNVNPASPSITDSLGSPLSYTLNDWDSRADTGTVDGQAATWWALNNTATARTVSITNGVSTSEFHQAIACMVLTGNHTTAPVGAHGKNRSSSASTIAQNFTATATNSWGFIAVCDWDALGSMTAGSGCTLIGTGTIPTTQISYGFFRRTNADGVNGGTTTMNVNLAGTSTHVHWAYVEVVPAPDAPTVAIGSFSIAIHPGRGPSRASRFFDRPMSTDIITAGAATQTITPAGIVSTEIIGNNSVTTTGSVVGNSTYSAEAFGAVAVTTTVTISAQGITSSEISGNSNTGTVSTIGANGIAGSEILGSPAISLTVLPNGVTTSERLGAATVSSTATISANGIGSSETSGLSTLSTSIAANNIGSSEQFGAPTVTTTVTISANGIPSAEVSGNSNTVTASSITPGGIAGSERFGAPAVTATATINAGGIVSSEAFGAEIVTLNVTGNAITSSELFGAPTVTVITAINDGSIASSERFGAATVTTTYTINANGITSAELSGNSNTTTASSVFAAGVPTSETLGAATVSATATIAAGGIPSGSVLGTASTTLFITPGGIVSSEVSGATAITTTAPSIGALGVTSSEQFGAATVSLFVSAGSISSTEKFGAPNVGTAATILVGAISSNEIFGNSQAVPGSLTRAVNGIPSGVAVGLASVTLGAPTLSITAQGIVGSEKFGYPHTGASVVVDVTTTLAPDRVIFVDDKLVLATVSERNIIYRD